VNCWLCRTCSGRTTTLPVGLTRTRRYSWVLPYIKLAAVLPNRCVVYGPVRNWTISPPPLAGHPTLPTSLIWLPDLLQFWSGVLVHVCRLPPQHQYWLGGTTTGRLFPRRRHTTAIPCLQLLLDFSHRHTHHPTVVPHTTRTVVSLLPALPARTLPLHPTTFLFGSFILPPWFAARCTHTRFLRLWTVELGVPDSGMNGHYRALPSYPCQFVTALYATWHAVDRYLPGWTFG